jgi:Homeodomain-like domain
MTGPYSVDLRERMLRAVKAGASRRAIAARFAVSPSCVIKLMQRWQRAGTFAPGPVRGGDRPHSPRTCSRVNMRHGAHLSGGDRGHPGDYRRGPVAPDLDPRRAGGLSPTPTPITAPTNVCWSSSGAWSRASLGMTSRI